MGSFWEADKIIRLEEQVPRMVGVSMRLDPASTFWKVCHYHHFWSGYKAADTGRGRPPTPEAGHFPRGTPPSAGEVKVSACLSSQGRVCRTPALGPGVARNETGRTEQRRPSRTPDVSSPRQQR